MDQVAEVAAEAAAEGVEAPTVSVLGELLEKVPVVSVSVFGELSEKVPVVSGGAAAAVAAVE